MTIKQKYIVKKRITNFFGGLGYFVCCFLWLTTVIVYTGFIKDALSPLLPEPAPIAGSPPPIVTPFIDISAGSPLMIIGIIITIVFMALAIYVFIRIPRTLVKTSKQIVHQTASTVTPVVMRIQHIQEPERHPIKLKKTKSVIIGIVKLLIIVTPLILILCSGIADQTTLAIGLAITIGTWLAGFSIVFFGTQYMLAKLLKVKLQDIL